MAQVHWYAVQTKPRAERQAKEALLHNGVVVYLPLVKVARVNPRAQPVVPLFPVISSRRPTLTRWVNRLSTGCRAWCAL